MKEYINTWYKNSPKNSSMAIYALSYEKRIGNNIYGNPMFKNITSFILYTDGKASIHIKAEKMAFDTYQVKIADEKKYNRKAIEAIFKKDFIIYG